MRVLETDPSISYKMGKNKRHRIRKAKENEAEESSDDALQGCSHVTKAVNLAAMRKVVLKLNTSLGECTLCSKEAPKESGRDLFGGLIEGPVASGGGGEVEGAEPASVCICLQCGHQGCDRNSVNKHALKHYKTPHSSPHCIIVNLTRWTTWCYACDEEVPPGPRIQGCIDFLYKQSGLAKPETPLSLGRSEDGKLAEASIMMNSPSSKSTGSCVKVKGLSNLGNTCFFNAVMQSICQTRGLESLLMEWGKHGKLTTVVGPETIIDSDSCESDDEREEDGVEKKSLPNIQTTYQEAGPITLSLLNFLQEMKGGTTRNGTVNPNALFTQVCKKAPRFKGFQQQDSHELLRYLIDCMRNEEIKRGQSSILKFFKLPETVNPRKVDEETKAKIKDYGRQVKHTFLDSLFGGQLVSTVKCEECKNASQVYEAFLDLSLPVMEEKPQRPNLVLIGKKKEHSLSQGLVGEAEEGGAAEGGNDKPSKYQERKNRRMQKKDAKKKGKGHKFSSFVDQTDPFCDKPSAGDCDKPSTPDIQAASDDGNRNESSKSIDDSALRKDTSVDIEARSAHTDNSPVMEDADISKTDVVMNDGKTLVNGARGDYCGAGLATYSSADGSKDGTDVNGMTRGSSKDDDDDTSDADVEDNLETDMSKLEISVSEAHHNTNCNSVANGNVTDSIINGVSNETSAESELCPKVDNLCISSVRECEHVCDADKVTADSSKDNIAKPSVPGVISSQNGNSLSNANPAADSSHSPIEVECHSVSHCDKKVCEDRGSGLVNGDHKQPVNNMHKTKLEYLKEARSYSMSTLAPRYQPAPRECSILSCLNQFTAAELLTGSNKVSCRECTKTKRKNSKESKADKKGKEVVYCNANKQYLIFRPPAVLTLHLKRFEQTGLTSRKVNRHVDFPLLLDLAPYCSSLCVGVSVGQSRVLYGLYGVVEHSGRLSGGHYTAYIKVRPGLGPHTQFLHANPPNILDILNMYLDRVVRTKDPSFPSNDSTPIPDVMDKETEARAESMVPPGRWFHISDSRVNEVTEAEVLKAQAYLLFYERTF